MSQTTSPSLIDPDSSGSPKEFEALQHVIAALNPLDDEARRRILQSAATFLRIEHPRVSEHRATSSATGGRAIGQPPALYSEEMSMSPKDFLLEKQPRSDVERIACLAYYLTHYRATPHFKTLDLSLLNTEAAQPKFSNAAYAANNAVKLGYIVPSAKGQRQLSAIGERFIRALPDREAAKLALTSMRRRQRVKRSRSNEAQDDQGE